MSRSAKLEPSIATGLAWMAAARVAVRILGLVSTFIVVRLLQPHDFGIMTMATSFAAALGIIAAVGFDVALIQKHHLTRTDLDSAWTLNVMLALVLATALTLAAPTVARYFGEPDVKEVLWVLAGAAMLGGLANTGVVEFRRNMNFRPDFYLQVGPKLVAVVATVTGAYALGSYRALLLGVVSSAVVGLALTYMLHPHRPRPTLAAARQLAGFSSWLLVGNAISFVRTRSVDLIVGRGLGAQAVGVYSVGSEIANLPSTELIAPLNRVLLPAYSRLAGSDADLRRAFRTALGFIALLVAPLSILVAATATPIVDVFLGSQWTAAVPVVHALGWAGAAAVLQANTGSVFNAMGKPRLIAATGTLHCVTLLPMLVAGLRWGGTEGVALATLVHGVAVGFPVTYGLLIGNSPLCWRDVLAPLARPALASGIMYLGVEWGLATAGPSNHMLGHSVRLVGGIVGGALLYSATAALLWMVRGHAEDPEAEFVRWLRRALTRRR